MGNGIPRAGQRRKTPTQTTARPAPKGPVEEAMLFPGCVVATVCLTFFALGEPSPAMLGILLLAIGALGTPAFMAMRRRWLEEQDRKRKALLGILTGLMLLSAMAAAISIAGILYG